MGKTPAKEGLKRSRPYHYRRNAQANNPSLLNQRFAPGSYRGTPEYAPRRIPNYYSALPYRGRRVRNQPLLHRVGRGSTTQGDSQPYNSAGGSRQHRPRTSSKSPKQKGGRKAMQSEEAKQSENTNHQEQKVVQEQENAEQVVTVSSVDVTSVEQRTVTESGSVTVEEIEVVVDVTRTEQEKKTPKKSPKPKPKGKKKDEKISSFSENVDTDQNSVDKCLSIDDDDDATTDINAEASEKDYATLHDLKPVQVKLHQLCVDNISVDVGNQLTNETEEPEETDLVLHWSNSSSESFESVSPGRNLTKSDKIITEKPCSSTRMGSNKSERKETHSMQQSLGMSIRSISSRRSIRSPHSIVSPSTSRRNQHDVSFLFQNSNSVSSKQTQISQSEKLHGASHNELDEELYVNDSSNESADANITKKKRKADHMDIDQMFKKKKDEDISSQNSSFLTMMSSPLHFFKSKSKNDVVVSCSTPLENLEQKLKEETEEISFELGEEENSPDVIGKELPFALVVNDNQQVSGYKSWCSIM